MPVTRPVLRYYGSKWSLAKWIYANLPPHKHLIVPFAGSLSELIQWPAARIESVNDLSARVHVFFKVLRERPDDLRRAIELSPWHPATLDESRVDDGDELERARRFWCVCWMAFGGGSGYRFNVSEKGRISPTYDKDVVYQIAAVAERLKYTQFFMDDALVFISRFKDEKEALIYADPPYAKDTRARKNSYDVEVDDRFHVSLAEALKAHNGSFVICGYRCDLYDALYPASEFKRVDRIARVNGSGTRVESLWTRNETAVMNLFDFGDRE